MKRRKGPRVKIGKKGVGKKGAAHGGVAQPCAKGSLPKCLTREPDAQQLAILGHNHLRPYFAERKCSPGFEKLEKTGKTGRGIDATKMISEDREDREEQVMPVPESPVKRRVKLRNMPPPPLDEVETKLEAAAKHKRDVGRRRKQ